MKIITLLVLCFVLSACYMNKLPQPSGNLFPINNVKEILEKYDDVILETEIDISAVEAQRNLIPTLNDI